jgi:CRP-like cAMP-binding protein
MINICEECHLKSKAASWLNQEDLMKLSCDCAEVKFKKGDKVIQQGALSSNVAYLKTGLAKIHLKGPYFEQIIKIVKAPAYLGIPTSFGDKINSFSVTVLEESTVCFIDISTFRYFLWHNAKFSYEIIVDLCNNELATFRNCASRAQKQVLGNLADVILNFSDNIYNSDSFTIPISREEIGNLIDASRESISRILAELNKDGIIRISGRKIEILNKKSLELISRNG